MYEFREEDAWEFARHQRIEVKQSGNQLHFKTCPYCKPRATAGNTRTFAIDLTTGQFKCLRASCNASGNMVTLSRDFDFSLGTEVDEYYRPKKQYRRLPQPKEKVVPKSPAVAYLEGRGIDKAVAELYEITTQTKNDNVLVFPFYDDKGVMQFVKYRKTDFKPEKDNNKEWCEKDCKPILFGMKQCKDFQRLIVTEGQIDSLSVAAAGLHNAVSVPNGAKGFTWVPYCWEWVRKFEEIVIFGDFEKGGMTLLEDFKKRFPNKIRYVQEKDYRGCKDANEILKKFGKAAVQEAVENAKAVPVSRVLSLAEVKGVDIYGLSKLRTGIEKLDRLLYGGLPFGQVHLIAGKRGEGKSTFASQVIAEAIEQNLNTFVYSGELPNYLFKSWLDFQIAGKQHITENVKDGKTSRFITNQNQQLINTWYQDKVYIYDSQIVEDEEQEDIIRTLEQAIMQYGIRVVLIDNLMTALDLDAERSSDRYDRQSTFVKKLRKIALRYDVAILLVAHRRKKNGYNADINDEISGTSDISNIAGVIINYDRDEELATDQRRLTVSKNRLFGKLELKGFALDYEERSKRIYGQGDDPYKQYAWDKSDGFMAADDMEIPF
ncbi:MAG: AAA family ATPase [Firmicutes bacterium]|nr:AAA family ATPase [Bacillota bacterium]